MKAQGRKMQGIAQLTVSVSLLLMTAGGCQQQGFGVGHGMGKECDPGEPDCFCRIQGERCDEGLLCIDDRCVAPNFPSENPKAKNGPAEGGPEGAEPTGGEGSSADEDGTLPDKDSSGVKGKACQRDEDCGDKNSCTVDQCIDSVCRHVALDGTVCDDADPCTAADRCLYGRCMGRKASVLKEDFSGFAPEWFGRRGEMEDSFVPDNSASTWQIREASESSCGESSGGGTGEDPAFDYSSGDDNVLAGVVVGGCHETRGDWVWDCLFSPPFETDFFDREPQFSYRRHLHAPGKRIRGRRRGVEHRVVLRRQDDSIEVLVKGHKDPVNDQQWELISKAFARQQGPASIGFCFRRSRFARDFAGWSLDDVLVTQAGCEDSSLAAD